MCPRPIFHDDKVLKATNRTMWLCSLFMCLGLLMPLKLKVNISLPNWNPALYELNEGHMLYSLKYIIFLI